jgi:hypothetical protein
MTRSKFDHRFFESTRPDRALLRDSGKTVNQLASALDLTDNAVRAFALAGTRRDRGAGGTIKGFRKPHYMYALPAKRDTFF